jgi:4-amino-4-deoxy-L-arabinose transferase-like glycosyltransferase
MFNFFSKVNFSTTNKVLLIFLLSLVVRISFITIFPSRSIKLDDTISWDSVGWNFLNGRGFTEIDGSPTSVRPPVYPIFLAITYFFFGRNYTIVYLVQCVVGSFVPVLIFFLAKKFFNDEKISFYLALCSGLWPAFIVYVGIVGTETLYSVLFILFFLVFYKANFTLKTKYYILSGIILGITNLTRSTIIFYPLFLIVAEYFFNKDIRKVYNIFLMFVISMILILPWTIRNYKVFGRFLLVNTSAGELFWAGTYEPWDGYAKHNRDDYFRSLFNLKNPVDNEKKMFREGIKNIINNPLGFLKLTIKKFFRLWFKPVGAELVEQKNVLLGKLMYVFQSGLVLLFIFGFIKVYNKDLLSVLVMFVYFAIMHNLITPIPRYRIPVEWLMVMFGSYGFLKILKIEKKTFI